MQDFKDHLKDQVNLLELMSHYVPDIKRVGNSYTGTCPFHDDQNPSLYINVNDPSNETFSCLACGAGSKMHPTVDSPDVYGFIKGINNFGKGEFYKSVEWLAQYLNVAMPSSSPEQQKEKEATDKWFEKTRALHDRYKKNLYNNEEAFGYLKGRRMNVYEVESFGLGFGDNDDDVFYKMNNRITFPIHDENGNIVSFAGRSILSSEELKKTKAPKYIHRGPFDKAPYDHPIWKEFTKNNYLYGFYFGKEMIRKTRSVILVEGYTDVIAMHQKGLRHTVSTMGTSVSEKQIDLLKRSGVQYVTIMTDGDTAGIQAAERFEKALRAHHMTVRIMPLEEGQDPYDFCQQFSFHDNKIMDHIEKRSRTLELWKIERIQRKYQEEMLYNLSEIRQLKDAQVREVAFEISQFPDPVQKEQLIQHYAEILYLNYQDFYNYVHQMHVHQ